MWNLEGLYISGKYYDKPFTGKVTSSRVKLGGTVVHYVTFPEPQPIGFRGEMRDGIMVEHAWVEKVMSNI
jgi:hypothetical protein